MPRMRQFLDALFHALGVAVDFFIGGVVDLTLQRLAPTVLGRGVINDLDFNVIAISADSNLDLVALLPVVVASGDDVLVVGFLLVREFVSGHFYSFRRASGRAGLLQRHRLGRRSGA